MAERPSERHDATGPECVLFSHMTDASEEDKPLSPKWFNQGMALPALAGMTIPLDAGVAGFIKDELGRPSTVKRDR